MKAAPAGLHKILIVDYDKGSRETLQMVLSARGYAAVAVPDAEVGMSLLQDYVPDLIIAEIILSRMNGLDFAREAVKRHPKCRVLLLAAQVADDLVFQARTAGFDFYDKPVNPPALIRRVSQLLSAAIS